MDQWRTREFMEGHPALIVIDIQIESIMNGTGEAIPSMPGYAEPLLEALKAIDRTRDIVRVPQCELSA